jgi:hypothetical protein
MNKTTSRLNASCPVSEAQSPRLDCLVRFRGATRCVQQLNGFAFEKKSWDPTCIARQAPNTVVTGCFTTETRSIPSGSHFLLSEI